MDRIEAAMRSLENNRHELEKVEPIPFATFLSHLCEQPRTHIRNVFQVFHDMVMFYVGEGHDEYIDDPESIRYASYDCGPLLSEGADQAFFADRIFANRFMALAEALRSGAQQNKIYIFGGPPGCGKSTFLNNLLKKFEEYANSEEGLRYEIVWRLDRRLLSSFPEDTNPVLAKLSRILDGSTESLEDLDDEHLPRVDGEYIEVPCPSHDNPILIIPKMERQEFFDSLFSNDEFKWNLSYGKEYDWVFRDNPCTICSSLYSALLARLKNPQHVFGMVYARPVRFNRRLGQGITVFNPGDRSSRQIVQSNPILQKRINSMLGDSNEVQYVFSRYARTNNGIYALMDIKSHNKERVIELHNIISDGVHKVGEIEENVNSLFLAVMNPEDNKHLQDFQSLSDRIEFIKLPYVLDIGTEVQIYRDIYGRHIDNKFLPHVLDNFARVVISTRLNSDSPALQDWIKDPAQYRSYCDEKLQLLKMEIYSGRIPAWLSEEDRKAFTASRRRNIIVEAETEGDIGLSGRDALNIFNDLLTAQLRDNKLIDMSMLCHFLVKTHNELAEAVPEGFIDSLHRMYDYMILQEVKEALYYYNEEQISRNIRNYLFALNYEVGSIETCNFTGDRIEVTEEFFKGVEDRMLGSDVASAQRSTFRQETQNRYTARTLTQEILVEGKDVAETDLYLELHKRFVYHLKEKVLEPFLENENFRRAIKDIDTEEFRTYDKRIRDDVGFLINNLCDNFGYTEQSARDVCIYVIDNDLAAKFSSS
ncbi:MAG: serine protein kinase PrkA [bacterium]|nr:serine protein kinase PrkA [bacterium]